MDKHARVFNGRDRELILLFLVSVTPGEAGVQGTWILSESRYVNEPQ